MSRLLHRSFGLRTHAVIASAALIALTGILGARAYFVADRHLVETRDLLEHDMQAQELVVRLESMFVLRDNTERKFQITGDPAYSKLAAQYTDLLVALRHDLSHEIPLASLSEKALHVNDPSAARQLKRDLEIYRAHRLLEAKDAAQGLLHLIMLTLGISVATTAWLGLFFVRGLLFPLSSLRAATSRIHEGDLSCRVPVDKGVLELRQLSQSFNLMAMRLQQLEKSKDDFFAMISHEIKNPLAALKEGLSLLASQGEALDPAGRQRAFKACLISSKRLELMINNLIKISQASHGERTLFTSSPVLGNLSAALGAAVDELRPMAEKRKMQLRLNVPPALPLIFDWDALVQVFSNLLINAIKYGNEATDIRISAQTTLRPIQDESGPPVPHVDVVFENTGKAIPPADTDRIFEPFFRSSSAGFQQGFGIGLHVVKRIVEAHRGGVIARSGEGVTRMHLWFPNISPELHGGTTS